MTKEVCFIDRKKNERVIIEIIEKTCCKMQIWENATKFMHMS